MKSAVYLKFLKRLKEIVIFENNDYKNHYDIKINEEYIHDDDNETVLEAIARNMMEVLFEKEPTGGLPPKDSECKLTANWYVDDQQDIRKAITENEMK